jgi:hypothetical protein
LSTDFILRTACYSEEARRKNISFDSIDVMEREAKKKYVAFLSGKKERLVSASDD